MGEAFADYSRLYVDLPDRGGSVTISIDEFDDVTGLPCGTLVNYNVLNFQPVEYSLGGRVVVMAAYQGPVGLCGTIVGDRHPGLQNTEQHAGRQCSDR